MAEHCDRVLLVEDDEAVRVAVRSGLAVHGFAVTVVADGESAVDAVTRNLYDVVVLDVGLPGMSGIDVCVALRRQEIDVPILMLSARDQVGDRVAGLQAGADDYLVKPFDLTELTARLGALIRRAQLRPTTTTVLRFGELRVDADGRRAFAGDDDLELTRREFDLLHALVSHPSVVLSRLQLLELVWGYDFDVDTNVVDVFVGYLRRKLAAAGLPPLINTVRGVGFVFEVR
ncbi:MAG TPA: response regulator transcription factor [Ilumatobacteraceae bacterium]|nr:response regulator transcription factor [Ilumatobacteraceae bacterium]